MPHIVSMDHIGFFKHQVKEETVEREMQIKLIFLDKIEEKKACLDSQSFDWALASFEQPASNGTLR